MEMDVEFFPRNTFPSLEFERLTISLLLITPVLIVQRYLVGLSLATGHKTPVIPLWAASSSKVDLEKVDAAENKK